MYRVLFLLFFYSTSLFSFSDNDMDGVADINDLCPNTPIFDLVSLDGCSKKRLDKTSPHHFDIIIGKSYSVDKQDSFNSSVFQANYYYKNFSIQFSTSYLISQLVNPNTQSQNDSYLNIFYKLKLYKSLIINFGVGLNFPLLNQSTNITDYSYSLSLKYTIKKFFILSGVGYTDIGEIHNSTQYQNTHFYNMGIGYQLSSKSYISINYYNAKNIYHELDNINTLSTYIYYGLDAHWFIGLNYSRGLNKDTIQNNLGIRIGYYW